MVYCSLNYFVPGPTCEIWKYMCLSLLLSAGVYYFVLVMSLLLAVLRILWLPRVQGIKMVIGCASTDRQAKYLLKRSLVAVLVYLQKKTAKVACLVICSLPSIQVTFL